MTHLTVEFLSLRRLSDMFIRPYRTEIEVSETSKWKVHGNISEWMQNPRQEPKSVRMRPGRWRKWWLSFCFQKLRGELLRSAPVHRLPAGSGLEVDPRAERVSRQLLLRTVPIPPQRRHHAQLGESLLHTLTNLHVALTHETYFHGKKKTYPSCSLQYNKWNGKKCPKMHHKHRVLG